MTTRFPLYDSLINVVSVDEEPPNAEIQ